MTATGVTSIPFLTALHDRGLNLYGGCEPITETLLGNVTKWKPTGCITFRHSNGIIAELSRFRFPMNCEDEMVGAFVRTHSFALP
jgi:hypothetical protein